MTHQATAALTGRERRRTDLYGRLRRILYGLVLTWANLPGNAVAADELAYTGQVAPPIAGLHQTLRDTGNHATPAAPQPGTVYLDSSVIMPTNLGVFEEGADWWGLYGSRDRAVPLQLVLLGAELPDLNLSWLNPRVIAEAREGLGMDIKCPGIGSVFLDLYTDDDAAPGDGLRWAPAGSTEIDQRESRRKWSFGGSVDVVSRSTGARDIVINPQLHLKIGEMLKRKRDIEATIVYAYWRPAAERVSVDERVLQAEVSWHF